MDKGSDRGCLLSVLSLGVHVDDARAAFFFFFFSLSLQYGSSECLLKLFLLSERVVVVFYLLSLPRDPLVDSCLIITIACRLRSVNKAGFIIGWWGAWGHWIECLHQLRWLLSGLTASSGNFKSIAKLARFELISHIFEKVRSESGRQLYNYYGADEGGLLT